MTMNRRSSRQARRSFLQCRRSDGCADTSLPRGRRHASARSPAAIRPTGQSSSLGGPFSSSTIALHAHYLALSNDRLLKVYRQRAGLPAPGADMGGWYDTDGFVPGHTLGQYISGLARFGAGHRRRSLPCKRFDELVDGFAATLGPDNQSILRPQDESLDLLHAGQALRRPDRRGRLSPMLRKHASFSTACLPERSRCFLAADATASARRIRPTTRPS